MALWSVPGERPVMGPRFARSRGWRRGAERFHVNLPRLELMLRLPWVLLAWLSTLLRLV